MCGITGIFDTRGRREVERAVLARMNDAQRHRGPDEGRLHVEPGLGFGHRRLSIIDIATGQQPLANEDGSVVVVQVGFSTNLARLLDSPPDDISPLDGKSLAAKKVRLLSVMAGAFSEDLQKRRFREYNVVTDVPAAQKVLGQWPTPIVASGFEIGRAILYPVVSIRQDYRYVSHHPVAEAYGYYRGLEHDQPTFDLTSVLYAVRPERGYFDLSPPGWIRVEDDGFTRFEPDPNGKHRYLIVSAEQIVRVREALCWLCSEPPQRLVPQSSSDR